MMEKKVIEIIKSYVLCGVLQRVKEHIRDTIAKGFVKPDISCKITS